LIVGVDMHGDVRAQNEEDGRLAGEGRGRDDGARTAHKAAAI
jgi:hypothetical protein